jgi:hypothetical protein
MEYRKKIVISWVINTLLDVIAVELLKSVGMISEANLPKLLDLYASTPAQHPIAKLKEARFIIKKRPKVRRLLGGEGKEYVCF